MHDRKEILEQIIKREKRAVLIVNTRSRKGRRLFSRAIEMLQQQGISLIDRYPVHDPVRLPGIVNEAIDRGCKLLVVGGGDGTISSVADCFAYRDVVLGILPLGTGNSFARTLGIPLALDQAVDVIVHGKVADIDLGRINHDYFANVASIGLSVAVERRISRRQKRYFGRLAYGLVGIPVFFSHQAFRCQLRSGERNISTYTHQLIIANGRFHAGTVVAPDANPDNRQLVIYTMGEMNRWQAVKIWLAALRGQHTKMPETNFFTAREVSIETDPPQYVDIDGEIIGATPLRATLAAKALNVTVPAEFQEPCDEDPSPYGR